jgi:hypothetical protein
MSPDATSYPIKISVDFRCVANHMQMWLEKKMVISHFGYWHFLSTANTASDDFFAPLKNYLYLTGMFGFQQ